MKESAIDYSVHGKFVESTPEAIADIEKMADQGIPTFKMFMTYKKEGVMSDDETMLKVFEKAKQVGGLPMVHCESNGDVYKRQKIDIAFVPLDRRQEEGFFLGMDQFMKKVGANIVFPMHCWGDFSVIGRLKSMECSKAYRDKVADINRDGEEFQI